MRGFSRIVLSTVWNRMYSSVWPSCVTESFTSSTFAIACTTALTLTGALAVACYELFRRHGSKLM